MNQTVYGLMTDKFGVSSQVQLKDVATLSKVERLENLIHYSAEMSASILKNRHSETSLPKQVLSPKSVLQ